MEATFISEVENSVELLFAMSGEVLFKVQVRPVGQVEQVRR